MKKQVTYLELLQMIKDGKQPNEVEHNKRKYIYEYDTYFTLFGTQKCYLTSALSHHTEKLLATYNLISYEEDILDEREKDYLKAVVKPFRNRVKTIERRKNKEWERIVVFYKDYDDTRDHVRSYMSLPMFKAGTMYKGMELNKEYTLEELGL